MTGSDNHQAIVFDLDGTLVDSAPDLHRAANLMLADAGAAPLSLATVVGFIGHGIPNLARQAMAARNIPEAETARMTKAMLDHYLADPTSLTRPYKGVPETLTVLRDRGARLGVCTNKLLAPSREILATLGLADFFEVVIGGDSLPVKKPDPAPLAKAFAALGRDGGLYVGDSEVDAETARAFGCDFALFTLGYRKAAPEDLPHRFRFDDYATFPGLIA